MTVKYGILAYDEPKELKTSIETPKKLFEFKTHENTDLKADATAIADNIFDALKGKLLFRFYFETEKGYRTSYQVNFNKDSRTFFEDEVYDDLTHSHNLKLLRK